MNSWEVSLLNKLYKTTEGFKPLEKLFLQERIDFNSARKDIIKTYKDAIQKNNLEYLQNNYITNIIDLNYQITSSIEKTCDPSLRSRDNSSILGNPVMNESADSEFLALATRDKIKSIEVTLKKPIIQTEDDIATLLNICSFLAYKEAIEHSYSFVQILNEIKTKNERRFLSQGLEYIDVLVLSALGRCRSWKKISKEARSSIPLLFEWFENIRKEQKEAIDMNAQSIATQSQKDQKSTKQKPVRKNDNMEFLDSVKKGDIAEVEKFLASGINVECADPSDRNKTAYHIACEAGNLELVKLLDKYNSNPEARDCEEMTPIFFALASENRNLIEYLVVKGVNLEHGDFQNRTPFYWACSRCSVAIVEYLYHKKCNINTMSKMQRNALSKTSYMGRTEIVKFLLSCPETQVNHTGERGRTALHMAVWGKAGGRYGKKVGHDDGEDSPEVAMLLLSHGADVNLQDLDGNTALNTAAASCAEASIPVLLRFGADLNIVNNLGETPLYKASQRGYLGVCSLLFETGKADPFIKSQTGNDCLEVSIANQYYKLVQFYVEKLAKTLDENEVYFDNICYRIAKTFKANEAVPLLVEVFSRKQITENMVIRKETLESLVNLKSEKVLDLLVPWLKVISDQGKMKENIQYALDVAFKCKWIGCFKYFSSVFPNEVAALQWKATDINLDFRTDDALYLLKHFNIDIFAKTEKNETVFHLLVSKKNTQVLSCISKLLMSALQGVQEDYSEQGISNIYLQNINLTDVVMFLNAKNSHGHSASELAVINKYYDVSAILERLIGEKLESLFTIPSYKLEVSQENNTNITHKCKEKLISIENQFKLDTENTSKTDIDIDNLFFRLTEQELNYFKSVTNNASHVTQHSPYTKIISERKIVVVDSENSLKEAVAKLSKASLLGVDMECYGDDSTKVSFVCLVQISTVEEDFIIDTLKLHPIINQYLESIFISENILKVFHGCDNDLKWLKSNFDIDVVNIFDTGRAYMLLNNQNVSVSLAWLTMNLLKVELNKAYQRADWRVRPLPQVMLDYARGDSCVILYIWYILCSEIKEKENSKTMMLEMMQKMARKCWKTLEEGNIPRIKVIPLDS